VASSMGSRAPRRGPARRSGCPSAAP
jgi:hypothetical protein